MLSTLSMGTVTILAAESGGHGEPAIHPYAVGGIALLILMVMLAGLLAFAAGREHS